MSARQTTSWISPKKLRSLARSGRTYDEIAAINELETGWKPNKTTVGKKLRQLGEERRHLTHHVLVPWDVRPEHAKQKLLFMLQAESRHRAGIALSDTDHRWRAALNNLLFGRGRMLVIGYHPEVGFYLTERADTDTDIIRAPGRMPVIAGPEDKEQPQSAPALVAEFHGREALTAWVDSWPENIRPTWITVSLTIHDPSPESLTILSS